MDSDSGEKPKAGVPMWLAVLLWAEAVAVLIALVMPITPSKTGSTWTPAHVFSADPTYVEKVTASFVLVNILLAVLGCAAWFFIRRSDVD